MDAQSLLKIQIAVLHSHLVETGNILGLCKLLMKGTLEYS